MANLSKIKRDKMIAFLEQLKEQHSDDESIRAFNEIENQLRDKKYGLVWEEHSEAVDEMLEDNIPVFCADPERRLCKDPSLPWNFIIEGDNLQALYLLEKTHRGKVDCIYIDPPYNTGAKDWKYNNDYVIKEDKRKSTAPSLFLQKEALNGSDRFAVNPRAVVEVVRTSMLEECDLDHDGKLDKHELEITKGYVFGTKLKTEAIEGVARTTHDMMKLNSVFGGEHQINNHDDGFIIRDAKRRIARAIGIDENISNNALHVLFGPQDMQMSLLSQEEKDFEREHKLIDGLTLREYNAFLVNNRDRLIEVFSRISADQIADIEETDICVSEWGIPSYQYYKQHKKIASTAVLSKNVFENYGNNILLPPNRTVTEVELERWCESYNAVKWYCKNGDKGDEFFSLVYRRAFRRNNFYPDYIIGLENGEIWIIEAKGGMTADGESNNIDSYAARKFDALKDYGDRHPEIKWGFVRAVGTQLYISNTEWTEDVTNRNVWKPIEVFI